MLVSSQGPLQLVFAQSAAVELYPPSWQAKQRAGPSTGSGLPDGQQHLEAVSHQEQQQQEDDHFAQSSQEQQQQQQQQQLDEAGVSVAAADGGGGGGGGGAGRAAAGMEPAAAADASSNSSQATGPVGGLIWSWPGEPGNGTLHVADANGGTTAAVAAAEEAAAAGSCGVDTADTGSPPHSQSKAPPDCLMVWLGPLSTSPALTHLQLTYSTSPWLLLNPETGETQEGLSQDLGRLLKRRYYLVEKARGASMVGLLMGTLGAVGYLEVLQELKRLAKEVSSCLSVLQHTMTTKSGCFH